MLYKYRFRPKLKSKRWKRWCGICQGSQWKNEFFEKINKQSCLTNKFGWTSKRTNHLRDKLIWGWTPSSDKTLVNHCANRKRYGGYKKKKSVALIDVLILFILKSCCELYIWVVSIHLFVVEKWVSWDLLPSVLHKIQYTILKIPYWTQWHCLRQMPQKSKESDFLWGKIDRIWP